MDLIAHHFYVVSQADVVHLLQLIGSPHASAGIVGITEQEYGGFLIGTLLLEVFPIHLKGDLAVLLRAPQGGLQHLTAVISYT